MIGKPRRHRGRFLDRAVNLAEVVVGEMQRQRGFQVLPLLSERVGEASEPPAPQA